MTINKHTYISKLCENCGRPFYTVNPKKRFCTDSCRVLACRKRATGEFTEENESLEFENNLITEDMSELLKQIQENTDLKLKIRDLEHEIKDLKKITTSSEDQSKHIGKLQIENERLEEEKSELDEAVKSLTDSYDRLNAKLLETEKKYQKEALENLFRSAIINRSTVTVAKVKEVLPEFAQTELTTEIDGYRIILRKNENQFLIKKI